MSENLQCVPPGSVITGWDFSTGGVKCLAFDLDGNTLAEVRLPTDLWTKGGVSELNVMQLEGQARASVRAMANTLRDLGRLSDWIAGGISAALGKGLLIACSGLTVALLFGAPTVAAASVWTVVATAVAGSSCLLAAAIIRREHCDSEEAVKLELRELVSLVRNLPGFDPIERETPTQHEQPFTSRLDRERTEQQRLGGADAYRGEAHRSDHEGADAGGE